MLTHHRGIISTFRAVANVFLIKFPNPFCAGVGTDFNECAWTGGEAGPSMDWKNPMKYYNTSQFYMLVPLMLFFGWFIPSIALMHKTHMYVEMQKDRLQSFGTRRRSISQVHPSEIPSMIMEESDSSQTDELDAKDAEIVVSKLTPAGLDRYAEGLCDAGLKWNLLQEHAAVDSR